MAGRVPSSYLIAYGRTQEYFQKIQRGTAPTRFTTEFLENLGFKNKSDRSLIPVLKALSFLDDSNAPTQVYREYLDANRGKIALGRQILQAYEGLFELNRDAHKEKEVQDVGKTLDLGGAKLVADSLPGESTDPSWYPQELIVSARRMAQCYVRLYLFENKVRGLVDSILAESHGSDWFEKVVDKGVFD